MANWNSNVLIHSNRTPWIRCSALRLSPSWPPSQSSTGKTLRGKTRGFTLLEVLIAVLILSLALVALVRTTALEARALVQVREATLAQWVASNVLAEARLNEGVPASGRRDGSSEMGGRRWRWLLESTQTQEPSIKRLDVSVYADDAGAESRDEAVARLSGFAWQ
ncbi:MAG: type II secretion system minor pseudopilin GspI [Pseudomarimonas sp.]